MTLAVIIGKTEYSLDDGTLCYWVGDDGLGMSPLHRLSERGPLQHGDTDLGYRLDPRHVRLVLDVITGSRDIWENTRYALLNIFKPSTTPIVLKLALNQRTYCLDCHYVGQMEMPSNDRLHWNQTIVVDLKANDPTFYDPNSFSAIFNIGAGADTWEIPFSVPFTVGGAVINQNLVVDYNGNVASYPFRIRITGPAEDLVLTNETLNLKLDFTGTTIAAGTFYDIDLRYGYKTVKDNGGGNKITTLTSDSDLAEWRLAPDPEVSDGLNSLSVECSGATSATKVDIVYYERFIGI